MSAAERIELMKSTLRAKKLAREKKKDEGDETSLVTPRGGAAIEPEEKK
jgi:hypothetical protein